MRRLDRREIRPELMDDPAIDGTAHELALAGLARLNRVSGSERRLWKAIRCVLDQIGGPLEGSSWRMLDVATGGGDLPIAIATRAKGAGLALAVEGCDVSERAVRLAGEAAVRAGAACRFFTRDVVREGIPAGYDLITMSLFTHHLRDEEVALLLRRAREAGVRAIVVNDLARSAATLALTWLGAHALTRSRVVHVDAIRSVRAAFTPREFRLLADSAGLTGGTVRRAFPAKFVYSWVRE